ncbi:MAG: nucleotidyltransferase family protein [Lachnospiraceae bacterium]|nr:nucleotidyltransferase family protein [Lachnospiraceae bacterium]
MDTISQKQETGCVIMASGLGRRFGSNKLLAGLNGKYLIEYILDTTQDLFDARVVVTRHEAVRQLCEERGIQVAWHNLPLRSDTVRLGVEAMEQSGQVRRICFCPSDQPLLRAETVKALLAATEAQPQMIWRLRSEKGPGMPVIFPDWTFEELKKLPPGKGGSEILRRYPDRVRELPVDDRELKDVDFREDLAELTDRKS